MVKKNNKPKLFMCSQWAHTYDDTSDDPEEKGPGCDLRCVRNVREEK